MGRLTQRRKVLKLSLDAPPRRREDVMAVEEPLEIRLAGRAFSITMRTPGDDFDLVAGFLVSEGIVWSPEQLLSMRFCAGEDETAGRPSTWWRHSWRRRGAAGSAAGPPGGHQQRVRHLRHRVDRRGDQALPLRAA